MASIYYDLQDLENRINSKQITIAEAEQEFARIFDECKNNSDNRRCAIEFAKRIGDQHIELYVNLKKNFNE